MPDATRPSATKPSAAPVPRSRWPLALGALLVVGAFIRWQLSFVAIQPIGAIPEGVTLVVWRGPSMEFVDSPDAMCVRAQGGVSLLCRGLMMGQVPDPIVRLPYSSTLYEWSTGGRTFDR